MNSDLDIGFDSASCKNFEVTSDHFAWSSKHIVIICFARKWSSDYGPIMDLIFYGKKSCFSFDGKMNYIGNSNITHELGGLAKYKKNLVTVGGTGSYGSSRKEATEIMERKNGFFIWSVVESNLFEYVIGHSLVTIPPSEINEEFVLLIGGVIKFPDKAFTNNNGISDAIFKFNGKWSFFGKLNKPRRGHNSIYWNGAVYVIGGSLEKMEVWKIADSPSEFKTKEKWPELLDWYYPHLFIVPDSLFPDY